MNMPQSGHVNILTDFYVVNLVIFLAVVMLGGALFVSLLQRGALHPWRNSAKPRRTLIVGLGTLWIVDALLQAQPLIVTQFVHALLLPLLPGQPTFIDSIMRVGINIWRQHPLAWDTGAIWMQFMLGVAILLGRDSGWRRIGLYASIVWGLLVWVGGEGLGSLFSGGNWFVGSPGSVLLYVIAAGLLLLPPSWWASSRLSDRVRQIIGGLWLIFAVLQAWPGSGLWTTLKLSHEILTEAHMAQPNLVSAPLYFMAHVVAQNPFVWNAIFVAVFLSMAVLWGFRRPSSVTWWLSVGITGAAWWVGQDLGVFGGMGTDPNSGALMLLGLLVYKQWTINSPTGDIQHEQPRLTTSA